MRPWTQTLRPAVHALQRNIGRSILTCLGIIIGIAAVIAMVEIGQGSSHMVQETIAKIGASVVQIDPSDAVKAGVSSGSGGRVTLIPDDADALLRECPSVRYAAPSVDCHTQVIYGNKNWAPRILGTAPAYLTIRNWDNLAQGACFTDDDVTRCAAVCVIGQTAARELFGDESPIGKEVRIHNVRVKVLGVLEKKGASVMGFDQDDFMVIPWTTVKFRILGSRQLSSQNMASAVATASQLNTLSQIYPGQPSLYVQKSALQAANYPQLTRFVDLDDIFVSASSPDQVKPAIKQITAVLRDRHHLAPSDPDDFRIRDLTEISSSVASTSEVMGKLLLSVATISLIVGGVGIMNIMLVSVTERTREIGLRMAVGARARDILRQFLLEATLLCLAGGLFGILIGRCASIIVTKLLKWPTLLSLPAIFAAVIVSVLVGIAFGFYPAWKASRLDPIEALRFE